MSIFRLIIALLLLVFAGFIVVMNWSCAIASIRNRRRGIDKHHSMVPVVSLLLVVPAYFVYPFHPKFWIRLVPLVDIANWFVVYWALCFLLRRVRGSQHFSGERDRERK